MRPPHNSRLETEPGRPPGTSEYRTRLIADVVTGKLDVRRAVANLPDEAKDLENWDVDEAEVERDERLDEAGAEADDGD